MVSAHFQQTEEKQVPQTGWTCNLHYGLRVSFVNTKLVLLKRISRLAYIA